MTMDLYAEGTPMVYRHKGNRYVGKLLKSQRRAAVIEGPTGKPYTVPWAAVVGPAPRKPKAGPA